MCFISHWVLNMLFLCVHVCVAYLCRCGRDTRWSRRHVWWWDIQTQLKPRQAQSEEISAFMSAGNLISLFSRLKNLMRLPLHRYYILWSHYMWFFFRLGGKVMCAGHLKECGSCQWFTGGGTEGDPAVVSGKGAPELGLLWPDHHVWGMKTQWESVMLPLLLLLLWQCDHSDWKWWVILSVPK